METTLSLGGHVLRDQFGQLKHCHLLLATEECLEGVVGIDGALVLRVLKTILLDVVPKLLGDLAA